MNSFSRRRFIRIMACAAGLSPIEAGASYAQMQNPATWRGTALGALASIEIHHPDQPFASRLVQRSVEELERLERIFSLYRATSAISTLNREGSIVAPPPELISLLSISLGYNALTGGAFDPTVQPLWDLYAQHFWAANGGPEGPQEQRVKDALSRIGCARISVNQDRIALAPGMSITLNGIAQGYITDRVTELLKAEGVEHSLVNLGEIRLIGRRPDGRYWTVGLADPDRPDAATRILELENCAVATSGGYGCRFDEAGRFTHLFDPATGKSPQLYKSVSVVAPTATCADALSTAFSAMEINAIKCVLRTVGGARAYITSNDGRAVSVGAKAFLVQ
jgi:FAD:protein FMN transferase